MPYVPYQFLTAGQKARLGGNRRSNGYSPRRRSYGNRGTFRGANGFSGYSSGRRRTRRSTVSYYR